MRDDLEQERTEKTENLCYLCLLCCLNSPILVGGVGADWPSTDGSGFKLAMRLNEPWAKLVQVQVSNVGRQSFRPMRLRR
jgi:hypothetical protein